MKYTVDQIANATHGACFYVTPGGLWLRVQFTEDAFFCALDEESGEEYNFYFEEMVEQGEDPEFHHLTRTKVVGTESTEWFEP